MKRYSDIACNVVYSRHVENFTSPCESKLSDIGVRKDFRRAKQILIEKVQLSNNVAWHVFLGDISKISQRRLGLSDTLI